MSSNIRVVNSNAGFVSSNVRVVNSNAGGVSNNVGGVVSSDVESSLSGRDVNSDVTLSGLTGLAIALLIILLYNLCNILMPS